MLSMKTTYDYHYKLHSMSHINGLLEANQWGCLSFFLAAFIGYTARSFLINRLRFELTSHVGELHNTHQLLLHLEKFICICTLFLSEFIVCKLLTFSLQYIWENFLMCDPLHSRQKSSMTHLVDCLLAEPGKDIFLIYITTVK